eukprot:m.293065 g.293065  ORF g.293065 m.293065 type:complete len:161 (-) comp18276_c0_seq1:136-618(-)
MAKPQWPAFYSHSWSDDGRYHTMVKAIHLRLSLAHDLHGWLDEEQTKDGAKWPSDEEMIAGVKSSSVFVAFITPCYLEKAKPSAQRYGIKTELNAAVTESKPIIHVILEDPDAVGGLLAGSSVPGIQGNQPFVLVTAHDDADELNKQVAQLAEAIVREQV